MKGREDVPDGILFADDAAKTKANAHSEEWKRYAFGLAVVESKRWRRPLDRRLNRVGEETAPSTQMLRYLRRVDVVTDGALRWGILTNGAKWRLYFQGAKSVSEEFCEIDLQVALGVAEGSTPPLSGRLHCPLHDIALDQTSSIVSQPRRCQRAHGQRAFFNRPSLAGLSASTRASVEVDS